jgi:uncharacterized membrane protein YfcA
VSAGQHVLAFLVMLVGAAVQGAVGFGSNLVAAPLLVLIDPQLVPGPAITASLLLNVLVLRRERAPHVWREIAVPVIGQVPGAVAGAAVLALVAKANLAIFFSILILIAVGVSISGLHPPRNRVTLIIAASPPASSAPRWASAGRRWRCSTSAPTVPRSGPRCPGSSASVG